MNIFDTFIGVLLAFIVKDFYDMFIQKYIKKIFINSKKIFNSKESLDQTIIKMVKEGKLKLIETKIKGEKKK